jgi:hypothetical protein
VSNPKATFLPWMKAWLAGMAVVEAKTFHLAASALQHRKGAAGEGGACEGGGRIGGLAATGSNNGPGTIAMGQVQ